MDAAEHAALREIKVVPYVMAELSTEADKVSNGTIIRTIRFNVESWRDAARLMSGPVTNGYWGARAEAYDKVLDLLDSINGGLK